MDFLTTGDISNRLNVDRDIACYVLRKTRVQPVGRAGQVRLFSSTALKIVEHHLENRKVKEHHRAM